MSRSKKKWIPVSERLPEPVGNTEYLVTMAHFDSRYTGRDVRISEYEARDDEIAPYFSIEVPRSGTRVVAWMPLPEPYGEEL